MTHPIISGSVLPGLYQSADRCSLEAQQEYFLALRVYLGLLILAAFVSFTSPNSEGGAWVAIGLFLTTLGILIYLRVKRPDDAWYNGRAVAESVKTRAWRWMMRADPYEEEHGDEVNTKSFISDLKAILDQNRSLSSILSVSGTNEPISKEMRQVRSLPLKSRLDVYLGQRVKNQAEWYSKKAMYNRRRARQWFWVSVVLHGAAIAMLLFRIRHPEIGLPIEVMATAASAVLTWIQAKKHGELNSSYILAAHEISLIRGEGSLIKSENEFGEFVINSEAAFSREHTQWTARKSER